MIYAYAMIVHTWGDQLLLQILMALHSQFSQIENALVKKMIFLQMTALRTLIWLLCLEGRSKYHYKWAIIGIPAKRH